MSTMVEMVAKDLVNCRNKRIFKGIKEQAERLGFNEKTLRNCYLYNDILKKEKQEIIELTKQHIIEDYQNGMLIEDICFKYDVSTVTVYNKIEGVEKRDKCISKNNKKKRRKQDEFEFTEI